MNMPDDQIDKKDLKGKAKQMLATAASHGTIALIEKASEILNDPTFNQAINRGEINALILEAIEKEEQRTKTVQNLKAQEIAATIAEEKLKEEIKKRIEVQKTYNEFKSYSPELLKEQNKYNENLKELERILKDDGEIPQKLKDELTKPVEESRRKHWQHIALTAKIAEEQEKHAQEEIKKIDKCLQGNISPEERKIHLLRKKEFEKHLAESSKIKQEVQKHYDARDTHAERIEAYLNRPEKSKNNDNKELISKLEQRFKDEHSVSHKEILKEKKGREDKDKATKIMETLVKNGSISSSPSGRPTGPSSPVKNVKPPPSKGSGRWDI